VELTDLDADTKPEVVVEFSDRQSWVAPLKWSGSGFVSLAPSDAVLTGAAFMNMDADAAYEAVTSEGVPKMLGDGTRDPVNIQRAFKLMNAQYRPWKDFYAFRFFSPAQPPGTTVFLGRTDVAYQLRVIKGSGQGGLHPQAAAVSWNGAVLTSGDDYRARPAVFTLAVTPLRENVLSVTREPEASMVIVAVEPVTPIVPHKVSPVVECVWDEGDGKYTASFGYNNPNPSEIAIAVGGTNKFTPAPINRLQTQLFLPGRHRHVFWIQADGGNLVWTLNGKTATASLNHPTRCSGNAPGRR
jgi:hypothetical protein